MATITLKPLNYTGSESDWAAFQRDNQVGAAAVLNNENTTYRSDGTSTNAIAAPEVAPISVDTTPRTVAPVAIQGLEPSTGTTGNTFNGYALNPAEQQALLDTGYTVEGTTVTGTGLTADSRSDANYGGGVYTDAQTGDVYNKELLQGDTLATSTDIKNNNTQGTDWSMDGLGGTLVASGQLGLGVASYFDNKKTAKLQRENLQTQVDTNKYVLGKAKDRSANISQYFG